MHSAPIAIHRGSANAANSFELFTAAEAIKNFVLKGTLEEGLRPPVASIFIMPILFTIETLSFC
jgi:hypothetical protein